MSLGGAGGRLVGLTRDSDAIDDRRIDAFRNEIDNNEPVQVKHKSPISRLPTELLADIFTYLVHVPIPMPYPLTYRAAELQWLSITHVCHSWRSTALNHAPLWTCPNLSIPGLANAAIQRSKSANLHIVIPTIVESDVLDTVRNQLMRIETLDIFIGPTALMRDFVVSLLQPATRLRTLTLRGHRLTCPLPTPFLRLDAPRLTRASFYSCCVPWESPLLRNVTSLEVYDSSQSFLPTGPQFLKTLQQMPFLQSLGLHFAVPSAIEGTEVVHLPQLRQFKLTAENTSCSVVLAHIKFPETTTLVLDSWSSSSEFPPLVTGTLAKIYDTMTVVSIDLHNKPNEFRLILQAWNISDRIPTKVGNQHLGPPLLKITIEETCRYVGTMEMGVVEYMKGLCTVWALEAIHISGDLEPGDADLDVDSLFSPGRDGLFPMDR